MNIVSKAFDLATTLHEGQKYGDKDYVEAHIKRVHAKVEKYTQTVDSGYLVVQDLRKAIMLQVVAILHDVLEDTDILEQDLFVWLSNEAGNDSFAYEVMKALSALTKKKDMFYVEYISNMIDTSEIVCVVKYFDSEANMEACIKQGDVGRAKKYLTNMCLLSSVVFKGE